MKPTSGKKSATGSSRLAVLYDGWPLACAPGSPAALHIRELLEALPRDVEPWLALPGEADLDALDVQALVEPVADTPAGRLLWEQEKLPRLARRSGARLLHTTGLFAPLAGPVPCLVSPAEPLAPRPLEGGFFSRLRVALNLGAQSNVWGLLWPDDLPAPPGPYPLRRLPPRVHSAFRQTGPPQADLPADFVLCPGPLAADDLALLVEAWGWASAALGADWTLLVGDLPGPAADQLNALSQATGIQGPVEAVDLRAPDRRAAAVRQARALLAVGPPLPWGDPFLQALACARPLAAEETPWGDARAGPAAYLAPRQDARGLGAAVLTLLVEEEVSQQISQAAAQRAAGWQSEDFSDRLWEVYRQAAGAA
jgi:hypothetical protein